MEYKVKTRNFNGNQHTEKALNAIAKVTGCGYWPAEDHDTKYFMQTNNALRAWAAFIGFTMLKGLSGGWTYIIIGNADVDGNYKSIYKED
jgi:hypothetical protein